MHKSHHIAMLADMIVARKTYNEIDYYIKKNNITKKVLLQAIDHAEFIEDLF